MDVTRRNLIHILGIAPVAAAAQTHYEHMHAAPPAPAKKAYQRKVFNDRQWLSVQVLCDLIIPADEHSGSATAAGVLGGLAGLDLEATRLFQKDFAVAAPAEQKQILDRIAWPARAAGADRRWAAFFTHFRDLTVSGFFSSRMGVADLPYLGNRAVAEWKGCDPKVWAVIEERMKNGYKGLGGEVKPWE